MSGNMAVNEVSPNYNLGVAAPTVPAGYKETEAGAIPDDWVVKSLNQLGSLKNGINKSSEEFGSGHPFVNLMDVFGEQILRKNPSDFDLVITTASERETFALRRGDVLFVRSSVKPSGVGLTTLVPNDLPETVYSGFLIRFRDTGLLDSEFKKHCFYQEGFRRRLIAGSTVSANTNINQNVLGSLSIAFPPDAQEQRAIATALSDVDALLEELDRLIAKKRDLKQANMQQLLTGQTRLPGFEGEWSTVTLGEIGSFFKGNGIKREQSQTGHLPCVRYGEIYTDHHDVIRTFRSWISEEVAESAVRIRKGDLLFAGSGETRAEIGKCVALVDDLEAYAGGDIVVLRPLNADPFFMGYLLNHSSVSQQKARLGQGDAVVHISANALSKVTITIPDANEQEAVGEAIAGLDVEISALEQRRAKTANIKQAVMQELLTGRIRLI